MTRARIRTTMSIMIVGLVVVSSASAGNLLVNPSFETGNFSGWTVGGSAVSEVVAFGTSIGSGLSGYANVRTGDYAAFADVAQGASLGVVLSQIVSVAPNQNLEIGFFASNWSESRVGAFQGSANGPPFLQITANGTPLLPDLQFRFQNDASWYSFSGTYANGAATSVTVDFLFSASGTGTVPASLDDFFVNGSADGPGSADVPEPCSLTLMGSALVSLLFARRRAAGRMLRK